MSLREQIARAARELCLDEESFHEVSKTTWEAIQRRIIEGFVHLPHHSYRKSLHWAWERLKEPQAHLQFLHNDAHLHLGRFVDDERVWFGAEDSHEKLWMYEGRTDAICTLLPQIIGLKEYYLISKKYQWMLCEDHHGTLHGVGATLVGKMQRFSEQHPERLAKSHSPRESAT